MAQSRSRVTSERRKGPSFGGVSLSTTRQNTVAGSIRPRLKISLFVRRRIPTLESLQAGISRLMLIRLFQQTTSGSVDECRVRRFRRRYVSFSRSLPAMRLARRTWRTAAGRTASCAPGAEIGAPMSWSNSGVGNVSVVGIKLL
jgi:hypothetical protein